MTDQRRHADRTDQARSVWLTEDYARKADQCAALLVLRPGWTGRVSRVEAVRVALDELHDKLTDDHARRLAPAGSSQQGRQANENHHHRSRCRA